MNPVRWLFRDQDLLRKEKELDKHLERVKERVQDSSPGTLVEVDVNFPKRFTKLSKKIARGHIEWRDFYSNRTLDIYSVHCRMEKGAGLREHRHENYDEYIYVIAGSIIIWFDSSAEGEIITPAERAKDGGDSMSGWNKIPAAMNHRIQSLEEHTHFISKFLKPDV